VIYYPSQFLLHAVKSKLLRVLSVTMSISTHSGTVRNFGEFLASPRRSEAYGTAHVLSKLATRMETVSITVL
jgi:hypothetical protein